jgi:hypothetical protein
MEAKEITQDPFLRKKERKFLKGFRLLSPHLRVRDTNQNLPNLEDFTSSNNENRLEALHFYLTV